MSTVPRRGSPPGRRRAGSTSAARSVEGVRLALAVVVGVAGIVVLQDHLLLHPGQRVRRQQPCLDEPARSPSPSGCRGRTGRPRRPRRPAEGHRGVPAERGEREAEGGDDQRSAPARAARSARTTATRRRSSSRCCRATCATIQNPAVQSAAGTTVSPTGAGRAARPAWCSSTVSRFGRQSSRFIIPPVLHSAPDEGGADHEPEQREDRRRSGMSVSSNVGRGSRTSTAGTTSPRCCSRSGGWIIAQSSGYRPSVALCRRSWPASHSARSCSLQRACSWYCCSALALGLGQLLGADLLVGEEDAGDDRGRAPAGRAASRSG